MKNETIQRLTSQMQQMQKHMNSMNGISRSGIESQCQIVSRSQSTSSARSVLSHDKRLPIDTWNSSGLYIYPSRKHYQGIHHSTTPGVTRSIPVHIGTGTPVARDEDQNRGTIPMPTFARRPSIMSSFFSVDIPMVGQQRQQIS